MRNLPLSGDFRVDRTSGPRYTKVSAPARALGGGTVSAPAGWRPVAKSPPNFQIVHCGQLVTAAWSVNVPTDATPGSATMTGHT